MVAIFGLSDLDYIVSLLGLGRLGYTVLLLSPRLAAEACVALLKQNRCESIVYHLQILTRLAHIENNRLMKSIAFLARENYDIPITGPRFVRNLDGLQENSKEVFILHSSGSTGFPKPLHFTHHRVMLAFNSPVGQTTSLSTLPCYHTHGLLAPFMNWNRRKVIYLWDGKVPQIHETIVKALELSKPEALYTVPYILKLLAEKEEGINLLRLCKMVSFSGSSCPDDLGNMLVSQGVFLGTFFGS